MTLKKWIPGFGLWFCVLLLFTGFGGRKSGDPTPAPLESTWVWVERLDGSKQCEPGTGMSLDAATQELRAAGVQVLNSRRVAGGSVMIQVCGAPTGSVHRFEIPKSSLKIALELGYQAVAASHEMK